MIFNRAAREPAHKNGCGTLPDNFGRPCFETFFRALPTVTRNPTKHALYVQFALYGVLIS